MKDNGYLTAGIVDPVSDFGVIFVDGKTGGEEDGEGQNQA